MKRFEAHQPYLVFMLIVSVFITILSGCGDGGGGGGHWDVPAETSGTGTTGIIPGAVCTVDSGPTIPTVTSSNPSSGNQNVTTSTTGVAGGGKLIVATFSLAMNPATINSASPGALSTFTLKEKATGTTVSGTVAMDTANKVATFTTSAALSPNTEYTVTITTAATSATGVAIACSYEWNFKTVTPAATGQAPVNLGTAGTYGIFASADAAVTLTLPSVLVEGDVGLMDGAGVCINCDATTVTGAIENGTAAAAQAQIDINAAYTDAGNRATGLCTLANNTEIAGPQGACAGYTDPPGTIGPTAFPTYLPGLYWSATTIGLGVGQTIVLDAQNNPDAVFIFQAGSAITTGTSSVIRLENGAQAKNVWWTAGTAATLGVSSIFKGTVMSLAAAVSVLNGAVGSPTLVEGRLFSQGAAATVGHDATVTVPAP